MRTRPPWHERDTVVEMPTSVTEAQRILERYLLVERGGRRSQGRVRIGLPFLFFMWGWFLPKWQLPIAVVTTVVEAAQGSAIQLHLATDCPTPLRKTAATEYGVRTAFDEAFDLVESDLRAQGLSAAVAQGT